MLERGAAAKYAVSVFHERYNDFDIYIEDTAEGYEKLFANLLSRSLSSSVTIERVFPLGGRRNVLDAARKSKESPHSEKRSVFILDGDLYLLCGEEVEIPDNTIVLPRYCIENFLIDKDVFLKIMDEEDINCDVEVLEKSLDYEGWKEKSLELLKDLFINFAIAHKLGSGIRTVARGASSVCANNKGDVDPNKVRGICNEIWQELVSRFGEEVVSQARAKIIENIDNNQCFLEKYVSAKDFSLPLLLIRVREITKTKAPNINLKMRFSSRCDVNPLRDVAKAIGRILERDDIFPVERSLL